ncbi:MAG: IS630 family transposase [Pyrinomonadaceae bacterium]
MLRPPRLKSARAIEPRPDSPRWPLTFFADELDIHWLPKVGCEWMLKGTQVEVMTPGTNQKNYLAGALNFATGKLLAVVGERKHRWLFIALLRLIEQACPATKFMKIYVVVDNYGIHKAKAVATWLAEHPRFEVVFLPSYCPRANPIERALGDVHDNCTRNHKRTALAELVGEVRRHLRWHGPWRYRGGAASTQDSDSTHHCICGLGALGVTFAVAPLRRKSVAL